MKKTSETIVFFGSGPVAAASLRLLADDFQIEAVVTKPRPAHHRGPVPVLDAAEELGLPLHTVTSRGELDQLIERTAFQSRVGVLIDFGIIVSQQVIDYFPMGIVNSHFSILPEWRGADPITFAVLSGQPTTGVSLMLLVAAMDEGPLLAYGEHDMPATITTPDLTDHLIRLSHALLQNTLPEYLTGKLTAVPQTVTGREISYSRKLSKDDGVLDWTKPASHLEREIRAYAEWPKSRTVLGDIDVVVTTSKVVNEQIEPCGKVRVDSKRLFVSCGVDSLEILRLKPAGKAEMSAAAFLAGYGHRLNLK